MSFAFSPGADAVWNRCSLVRGEVLGWRDHERKTMVIDRRRGAGADAFVSVRLTHKYADAIDGVDLSKVNIGDDLRLPAREAVLLVAEGWAVQSGAEWDDQPELGPAMASPCHPLGSTNAPCECGHAGPPPRSIQLPSEPTKV